MSSNDPPSTRRIHVPAVIGLACSVILCCPITSLVGALLGWISLRSINASGGVLAGRRLAIGAIILGLVMLPIQFLLLSAYDERSNAAIDGGIRNCVETVFDTGGGDRAAALAGVFTRQKGVFPSIEEVDVFVATLTEAYGPFQSVSVVQRSVEPEFSRSIHVGAIVLTFEDSLVTGGVVCEMNVSPVDFSLQIRLIRLEVSLPGGRELNLPVGATEVGSDLDPTDGSQSPPEGEDG